jgi:hypothetical protein
MKQRVLIWGMPRSGTTALKDLLNTDSKTLLFNEGSLFQNLYNAERLRNRFKSIPWLKDETKYQEVLDKNHYDGFNLIEHYFKEGYSIVGEKWVDNNINPQLINDVDTKVLVTLRNPKDNIASRYRHGKNNTNKSLCYWQADNLEEAARLWLRDFHKIYNCILPNIRDFMIVRYEDSVNNPENLLKRISEFVGHEFNCNYSKYIPTNIGSWDLDFKDDVKVHNRVEKLSELLGY